MKAVLKMKPYSIYYNYGEGKQPESITELPKNQFKAPSEINSVVEYNFAEKIQGELAGHVFIGWAMADSTGELLLDEDGEIIFATTLQAYLRESKENNTLGNLYLVAQYEAIVAE
jgi:hypothetical protein